MAAKRGGIDPHQAQLAAIGFVIVTAPKVEMPLRFGILRTPYETFRRGECELTQRASRSPLLSAATSIRSPSSRASSNCPLAVGGRLQASSTPPPAGWSLQAFLPIPLPAQTHDSPPDATNFLISRGRLRVISGAPSSTRSRSTACGSSTQ